MQLLLASIPSPDSNAIHLGDLQLRAYGLMIALGVIAAVWLTGKRFEQAGIGTRDDASAIALWAVPAGVIGARLYHVATDWELFRDDPGDIVKIWEGGLGIWGGIAVGVAVGVWQARKRTTSMAKALDAATPALALAQAIGRLGNWWNQELFGRPTDLPWALEIDPEHRPAQYSLNETFHPTFLYESLWNLFLCGLLIWVGRRWTWLRPGRLFLVYVAGYTFIRFFIEGLRVDPANEIAGLRVNEWTSLILFTGSVIWLFVEWRRRGTEPVVEPEAPADEPAGDPADGSDEPEGDAADGSDDEPDGSTVDDDERLSDPPGRA